MARIDEDGIVEFAVEIRFEAEINAFRRPGDIESIRALEGSTGIDLVDSIRTDGSVIFANWVSGAFRTRSLKDVAIVENP